MWHAAGVCQSPSSNHARRKNVQDLGLRELAKILGFLFNISVTAEGSDFEFGMLLGFAKYHHQIARIRKGGRGPELRDLPNIGRFLFNIYTMAEASDFKFGK